MIGCFLALSIAHSHTSTLDCSTDIYQMSINRLHHSGFTFNTLFTSWGSLTSVTNFSCGFFYSQLSSLCTSKVREKLSDVALRNKWDFQKRWEFGGAFDLDWWVTYFMSCFAIDSSSLLLHFASSVVHFTHLPTSLPLLDAVSLPLSHCSLVMFSHQLVGVRNYQETILSPIKWHTSFCLCWDVVMRFITLRGKSPILGVPSLSRFRNFDCFLLSSSSKLQHIEFTDPKDESFLFDICL